MKYATCTLELTKDSILGAKGAIITENYILDENVASTPEQQKDWLNYVEQTGEGNFKCIKAEWTYAA